MHLSEPWNLYPWAFRKGMQGKGSELRTCGGHEAGDSQGRGRRACRLDQATVW